ncbi:response regulator transcription factor [Serpentinicella alkaliphila]|uniref:Stage 0 sporulation protein A homolog n=1 Tax=Serpentinicella alkaliphila TaxID=1734049 RepID=A0A4R2TG02_9FIRM|nr:response regulator transcription factor [Serpentinicella alkaliphila]QUH25954.1 response regulator transcription factor [Serpentinicella alkaliphila]TCQ02061.1 LuxR family two component transcriptional regulator [Serpentinicella alkaliphila]
MKIIIVDDDILVSSSLKTIIESNDGFEVLAVANSGEDAIKLYKEHHPEILLMDIRMGKINGLEAAAEILNTFPDAKVLFLTTFADDEYIIKALKIGAKGYILKQHYNSIVPALNAVYCGQSVFGEEIITKLPSVMTNKENNKDYQSFGISEKEFEIISLVSKGLSNKEIAKELYLSEGTIRNYISVILEKLELRDRTQLAIFFFNHLL